MVFSMNYRQSLTRGHNLITNYHNTWPRVAVSGDLTLIWLRVRLRRQPSTNRFVVRSRDVVRAARMNMLHRRFHQNLKDGSRHREQVHQESFTTRWGTCRVERSRKKFQGQTVDQLKACTIWTLRKRCRAGHPPVPTAYLVIFGESES